MTRTTPAKRRIARAALALLIATSIIAESSWDHHVNAQEDSARDELREDIPFLQKHVRALSDERMGGRGPDSDGLIRARDYIVEQFTAIGVAAAGEDGYLTPLEVVVSARRSRSNALKLADRVLAPGAEFSPLGISDEVELSGAPVFVGYGLSLPQYGWDDYAEVDVEDRVVLALTGAPPAPPFTLAPEEQYLLDPSSRAAVALAHGARAILFINDPRSHGDRSDQRPDELSQPGIEQPLTTIAVGAITAKAATRALAARDVDLEALQLKIDAENKPHSVALDVPISGNLGVDRTYATVHNIIARIPGKDASLPPVILGAHYDGLGFGFSSSRGDGERALHPGADDNASGVALLLWVARHLAKHTPERDIYFVAFSAEELGMLGSHHFARAITKKHAKDRPLAITVDMVGRLGANGGSELSLLGAKTWRGPDLPLTELAAGANLTLANLPSDASNSDHIALMHAGIHTLHLTTGRHGDYHTPRDTEDRIVYEGVAAISRFTAALVRELSNTR